VQGVVLGRGTLGSGETGLEEPIWGTAGARTTCAGRAAGRTAGSAKKRAQQRRVQLGIGLLW